MTDGPHTNPTDTDATDPHDVIVVGSGVAGLTAAATAARSGARVALVEGHTPGGRARTDERDGFALNLGPHAVYDRGPGHQVLDDLDITLDGVRPPKAGMLGWEDHTAPLPQGIGALVSPFLGAADKARLARAMARVVRTDPASVAHLTVAEWLDGLLPETPRAVLATLVRVGTYCADTDVVSADVAVHQLKAAAHGVTYLHGGWAQLTGALRAAAGTGVDTVRASATAVGRDADGPFVRTDDGRVLRAGRVVVASGSPAAVAALLPDGRPTTWDRLGPAVTASCLDLGLRRPPEIRSWFGVDRPHYLVAHAPGADLAPAGRALVHVMRNLRHDETTGADELRADLWALAGRAGITHDDVVLDRYLHRMVVISASVTPAGGGLAGRPAVTDTGVDGVLVAGDWVGPTGWLADASLVSGAAAGSLAAEQARAEGPVPTGARR
jgi:phytoene dehydrogenase-like protein